MRTAASNAPLALVARRSVLDAPLPSRAAPAVLSDDRIGPREFRTAAAGAHARVLRACLNELPERYRTALWLSDIEQQPIQEVAALLDVTIPLAATRLERARKMLAKALCRLGIQRL